jgi:hypothetical protein
MDLRIYYQKIRDEEGKIGDAFPVVVSRETQDGGKDGVMTEVPRALAAKMLVDGSVRLAKTIESKSFRDAQAEARRAAEQAEAAKSIQLTMMTPSDIAKLTNQAKKSEGQG